MVNDSMVNDSPSLESPEPQAWERRLVQLYTLGLNEDTL